ncbi:MAG: hypothetical protein J0I42_20165 [Bosea sp.]|uniref:hypothetical protein n=1 Tax=Bosea sp. (in: a-proteobacteria) TaxID=1871050 RepID=UPI001AC7B21B|nr:hypothetical protein [Bosea sp. (in: a-proteobacteria)]MBN9454260.1 hypothetical protein [Bosea sp. (in: a-proteobacteria)]
MNDARACFNRAIGLSLDYLRFALDDERRLPAPSGWLDLSVIELRRALAAANAMGCPTRKRLCFRNLSKLRARRARGTAA